MQKCRKRNNSPDGVMDGQVPFHNPKRTESNKRAGFTLMELMVVIAMIGILAAIAVPNGISWRRNAQFNSGVREVKANIERTRMFAIRSNVPADVVFFNGANTITCVRRTRVGGALNVNNEVLQLEPGITVASNFAGGTLTFNNRGMANPGTVTVNGPNGLTNNIVVAITGNSQVQ